jgi:hypothetical protein
MPIRRIKEPTSRNFEPWVKPYECIHREHEPPRHIVIKQGEILEHECPACKQITILRPPMVTH